MDIAQKFRATLYVLPIAGQQLALCSFYGLISQSPKDLTSRAEFRVNKRAHFRDAFNNSIDTISAKFSHTIDARAKVSSCVCVSLFWLLTEQLSSALHSTCKRVIPSSARRTSEIALRNGLIDI